MSGIRPILTVFVVVALPALCVLAAEQPSALAGPAWAPSRSRRLMNEFGDRLDEAWNAASLAGV